MAAPKTQPTSDAVPDFLDALHEPRRSDGHALVALMQAVTGEPPVLWGTSIVGFGRYANTTADGRVTPWPIAAFAPRKGATVVYVMTGRDGMAPLLATLGTHRVTGTSCLSIKRLADVDMAVLRAIVELEVAAMADRRTVAT